MLISRYRHLLLVHCPSLILHVTYMKVTQPPISDSRSNNPKSVEVWLRRFHPGKYDTQYLLKIVYYIYKSSHHTKLTFTHAIPQKVYLIENENFNYEQNMIYIIKSFLKMQDSQKREKPLLM